MRHPNVMAAPALAVILTLLAAPATAGPPSDRLRDFFSKVNAVLADPTTEAQPRERVARIRRLVTDIADMHAAATAALGPEWETRTAGERDEFVDLFAELLERAYVGRLAGVVRVTGGVTMTYIDERVDADTATVTTALRGLGGKDGHVEYRMTKRGERWRVRDIVLDGVSIVENYRAQFRRLLHQESYAEVVAAMRAKIADESLMFAGSERRVPAIVSTPRVETDIVAAAPPAREESRPPAAPPAAIAASARKAGAQAKTVAVTRPSLAEQRAEPVVVATASAVVRPPAPTVSPAPIVALAAPAAGFTPFSMMLGSLLFVLAAMGGAAYLRLR